MHEPRARGLQGQRRRPLANDAELPRPRLRARTAIAVAASVTIHALVLSIRVPGAAVERTAGDVPRLLAIEAVPATRIYEIVPVDPAPARRSPAREPDPRPATPPGLEPPTIARSVAPVAGVAPPAHPTGRPGPDPRLLWPPPTASAAPDAFARARDHVAARLEPFNDSLIAEREAARRAKEWTSRDGSGRLWGITPDSIHLGGLAIPLRRCSPQPCPENVTYNGPPGRRDEYYERLRGFRAIEEQAARAAIEKVFQERVRAIRERTAKRDTTGTTRLP